MWVTIGVINQVAQNRAYASGIYAKYSNLEKPYRNYDREYTYGTLENDFCRVDGTMLFLPRDGPYFNQGIVTEGLLGSITTKFEKGPYDIKGLTVEFGEVYPVDFKIISDNKTVQITGNADGHFTTDEVFADASYIQIVPFD